MPKGLAMKYIKMRNQGTVMIKNIRSDKNFGNHMINQ
jgi:hypothetical protein